MTDGLQAGTAKFEAPSSADCVNSLTAEMAKMTVIDAAGLTAIVAAEMTVISVLF